MYSLLRVSLYISVIKQENQIYVAYSRPNDWTDWGIYLAKKTKILFYYFFIPRATPGSSASSLHSREFNIENRIYREELKESLGMNFFSPFQPEREFKVYKSYKCSQIICSRVH